MLGVQVYDQLLAFETDATLMEDAVITIDESVQAWTSCLLDDYHASPVVGQDRIRTERF
jgi:hypothetical protein